LFEFGTWSRHRAATFKESLGGQMGLIYCPKCSQSVSDAIDECPYCRTPLPKNAAPLATPQTQIVFDRSQPVQPPFFAVSLFKLTVLSICTFGLYKIYWFWRNWNRIRVSGEPEITPSLRAFFAIIYCYPCFIRIKLFGISRGVIPAPPIGILAICYILAALSWRLPRPMNLVGVLTVVFLLPIQSYVNRINASVAPGHDPNSRFGVWNWIAILVGGLLFILAIIGSILPDQ
jgi:hypothetical protein